MTELDIHSLEIGVRFEDWASLPDPLDTTKGTVDWTQNACIGRQYSDQSVAPMYYLGFRHAAILIASHVRERGTYQDTLVYPFLFNWRHHYELILKEIIRNGRLLHDESGDISKIGHRLGRCWRIARPLIVKAWPGGDTAELDTCDKFINILDDMDPTGQAFRYVNDNNTENRHLSEMSLLNIEKFNLVAMSVADFLSGCLGGMESYVDWMHEQLSESYEHDEY